MNTATPKIRNRLIGLSMLMMLTVAIIAGQARANLGAKAQLPLDTPQLAQISHQAGKSLTVQLKGLKRLEALPTVVNTMRDLPFHIEIDIETGLITATPKSALAGHE